MNGLTHRHCKPIILFIALLVLGLTFAYPQEKLPYDKPVRNQMIIKQRHDSLRNLIRSLPDDTLKIKFYFELINISLPDQIDSAIRFAKSSYAVASKLNNSRLKVMTLLTISDCYGNSGSRDYHKSLEYAYAAAEIAETHNLYSALHEAYSHILNLYFYIGDFANAMEITNKGLLLAEKHHDKKRIAQYYNLFGFIYLRQGSFADAENYYKRYLSSSKDRNDSLAVADSYNCLGEVFMSQNKYKQSLEQHLIAWKIYNRNYSSIRNFKVDQMAYTAFRISQVYKMMDNYQSALSYASIGFEHVRKNGVNEYDLTRYLLNTSELYMHTSDQKRALDLLHHALSLSKQIKHSENIRDAYRMLSTTYQKLKRYDSAYHYQLLYDVLKDSIVNRKSLTEIQRIHAKYNLEKKDEAIAIQQAQLERQQVQRNAILVTFGFMLIILLLLYNWYRLKQKNKFQTELAHQQNELFHTIVTFQDTERKRIAQDIHDSVGSVLSVAKLQLSALEEIKDNFPDDHKEKYKSALLLLDQSTVELRNISHNIMPAALSRLGLVAALENLIDKISDNSGVRFSFNVYGFTERLVEKTEIGIYPIVLELVNNVLKHAQATQATIQLIRHPQCINITVEDNGKGFNINTKKDKGIGLQNVISRVQYLKGTINIDSAKEKGTSIIVDIPY